MKYVFHGLKTPNLKVLKPKENGFGKKYVYATLEPAFAVIFINREGSLYAGWKKSKGVPCFYERKKGYLTNGIKELKDLYMFLIKKISILKNIYGKKKLLVLNKSKLLKKLRLKI